MTLTEKSGHLAWCALVALALARQEGWRSLAGTGKSLSHPLAGDCAEATAFPPGDKSGHRVAVETEAPAGRQREAGQQAELTSGVPAPASLSEQNDLFRLTYALETAKDMHWNYRLLSDREWSGRNAVALSAGVNGIYLSRANLDVAFDDSGRQINPLTARLTGNVVGVMKVFNRCGWQAEPESGASLPHQYSLDGRTGSARKGGLVADLR
ncbi:Uncharacterised protein [Citrobacter freundii]|nr:Uncharacterised protein [Citrobacter freundii]